MLDRFIKQNKKILKNLTVVSPDYGSVKRSRSIAQKLGVDIAIVDKMRPKANQVKVSNILGDVSGKDCLMVDDMIDTGGTMISAAALLKEKGAKTVSVLATHALFNGTAIDNFTKAKKDKVLDSILVTDTIPNELPEFIKVVSVDELIANAIQVFAGSGESMTKVYKRVRLPEYPQRY